MKKALLILAILLLSAYCYAQDDPAIKTAERSNAVETMQVDDEIGVDSETKLAATGTDIDPKDSVADEEGVDDDKGINETSIEYADRYYPGTAQRELNVQDYGVGDLGEESLE